ncbi:hypothetical protein DPEC_G00142330 [Dallia pectoralis]|uniref:Uncharacterized protein n=1 Tax=Dallia pectoralis TaxID=75939 RepID=A0ACC2GN83_DALPE|nr:hypothetical protein DPEC_G00142330 [Dallia pectoralis]
MVAKGATVAWTLDTRYHFLMKNSLQTMVRQATRETYSWKSTDPSLLASRSLKILSTFFCSPSSALSRSLSSPLLRVNLSPSLPEYLWKAAMSIAIPCWTCDMLTTKHTDRHTFEVELFIYSVISVIAGCYVLAHRDKSVPLFSSIMALKKLCNLKNIFF